MCCPFEAMGHNWSQWDTMGVRVEVLNTLDWTSREYLRELAVGRESKLRLTSTLTYLGKVV